MVTLTVLKVSEPNCLAAKTISLNDAGEAQPDKFKIGTWFHYEQREVEGIKSLSTLLFDMANDRYAFVIREQLAKSKDPTKLVKRLGVTAFGDLLNVTCKQSDLEERNVLFMQEGGQVYLKKLFDGMMV